MKLSKLFKAFGLTTALVISSSTTVLIQQNKSLAQVVQENTQNDSLQNPDSETQNSDNEIQSTPVTTSCYDHPVLYYDDLIPGEQLGRGDCRVSYNGNYAFQLQLDGNLVLYNRFNRPVWASHTNGKPVGTCVMQTDGNLVIYSTNNKPLWASNTAGHPGAYLIVQNDGNVVIYGPNGRPIWATNTVGK